MKIVGLLLIALGIVGLAWGGFRYTTRETIVDVGPFRASAEREHTFPIAPVAGLLLVGAGAAVLFSARRYA